MATSAAVISTNERQFVEVCHRAGTRADGRTPLQMRKLLVSFDRSRGRSMAEVQLGRTRVAAVTTAEVVAPYPDRPSEGFLAFDVDLSPMAVEAWQVRRPSALKAELTRALERLFRDARALDTEALCITSGDKVWSVRCDVRVLDHAGNLTDAAVLASICSLRHFRRRDVSVEAGDVIVHSYEDREPVPLTVHHTPVTITFGLMDEAKPSGLAGAADEEADTGAAAEDLPGEQLLLDPSDREELVCTGRVSIGVNALGEICLVRKLGGAALPADELRRCARLAVAKGAEVSDFAERALADAQAAAAALERQEALGLVQSQGLAVEAASPVAVEVGAQVVSTASSAAAATSERSGAVGAAPVEPSGSAWERAEDGDDDGAGGVVAEQGSGDEDEEEMLDAL